jgi:hypothetical protein
MTINKEEWRSHEAWSHPSNQSHVRLHREASNNSLNHGRLFSEAEDVTAIQGHVMETDNYLRYICILRDTNMASGSA